MPPWPGQATRPTTLKCKPERDSGFQGATKTGRTPFTTPQWKSMKMSESSIGQKFENAPKCSKRNRFEPRENTTDNLTN